MSRFSLVPERCRVDVDARATLHDVHGGADGLSGVVEAVVDGRGRVDLAEPYSAHVEVPVARISADNELLDAELRRRMEAGRYPQAVGDVRSLAETPDGRYRVGGDLSLHGVTRPVEGSAGIRVSNGEMQVDGEFGLDVRDFGVDPPRLLMLRVSPEVAVRVALVATDPES